LESIAETQPKLKPAFLRLSAMISQYLIEPLPVSSRDESPKRRNPADSFTASAEAEEKMKGKSPRWESSRRVSLYDLFAFISCGFPLGNLNAKVCAWAFDRVSAIITRSVSSALG